METNKKSFIKEIIKLISSPSFITCIICFLVALGFYNFLFSALAQPFGLPSPGRISSQNDPIHYDMYLNYDINHYFFYSTDEVLSASPILSVMNTGFLVTGGLQYISIMLPIFTILTCVGMIVLLHTNVIGEFKSGMALLMISNKGRKNYYLRKLFVTLSYIAIICVVFLIPIICSFFANIDGVEAMYFYGGSTFFVLTRSQFFICLLVSSLMTIFIVTSLMYSLSFVLKRKGAVTFICSMVTLIFAIPELVFNAWASTAVFFYAYVIIKLVLFVLSIGSLTWFIAVRNKINLC